MPVTSIFLRPWHETDAADLQSIVGSTPDLNTQIGKAALEDVAAARDFIKSNLKWQPDAAYNFAIDLGGRAVGNIGLSNIDNRHRTAWMSYWVSSHVRGQKLATRGAASLANWAINELSLFRIELGHRTNNPASCKAATRAGFIPEGIERSKLQYGDTRFDVETHARLASDPMPVLDLVTISVPNY